MKAPESIDPRWSTYPDTILEIHTSPLLRVDLRAPLPRGMARQLRGLGLGNAWAHVSAHNPGRMLSPTENEERDRELSLAVEALGAPFIRADGVSPDGTDRERGFAIGLERGRAIRLAAEFGQSATFWFDGERFWLDPALVGDQPIRLPVTRGPE